MKINKKLFFSVLMLLILAGCQPFVDSAKQVRNGFDGAVEFTSEKIDQAKNTAENIKTGINQTQENIQNTADAINQKVEQIQETGEKINQAAEAVTTATESLKNLTNQP